MHKTIISLSVAKGKKRNSSDTEVLGVLLLLKLEVYLAFIISASTCLVLHNMTPFFNFWIGKYWNYSPVLKSLIFPEKLTAISGRYSLEYALSKGRRKKPRKLELVLILVYIQYGSTKDLWAQTRCPKYETGLTEAQGGLYYIFWITQTGQQDIGKLNCSSRPSLLWPDFSLLVPHQQNSLWERCQSTRLKTDTSKGKTLTSQMVAGGSYSQACDRAATEQCWAILPHVLHDQMHSLPRHQLTNAGLP